MNIRKLHNDKSGSKKVAKVGLDASLRASIVSDDAIIDLHNLMRDYHYFKDLQPATVLKLHAEFKVPFLAYLNVFSKAAMQISLKLLEAYPLTASMLTVLKDELVEIIHSATHSGEMYVLAEYDAIYTAVKDAAVSERTLPSNALRIRLYIEMYREYQAYLDSILEELHQAVGKLEGTPDYDRISFIQTLHGVGFLSAVVLITEMGPSDLFSSPKEPYAYSGLNPGVNDPGKFHGGRVHMSKWGSNLARRILHMVAINNLKMDRTARMPVNPIIYDYYTRKCISKKKSTAVGAVTYRICNTIFAMLRDNGPFELITPEEHRERYATEHPESVNTAAWWRFGLDFEIP